MNCLVPDAAGSIGSTLCNELHRPGSQSLERRLNREKAGKDMSPYRDDLRTALLMAT
jgi:hypothetical protein